jgi:uncharacterized damage-inducible protein DinB
MIEYGSREMASAFRTVRTNTIRIAEEIPEADYGFVAAPGVRSVSEQLRHVAFYPMIQLDMHRYQRVTTLAGYDFGALVGRVAALEQEPRSKSEIVALLKKEGAEFAGWLETLSPEFLAERFTDPSGQNPKTRFESLLGAKEHEMHHRAQLMLIQRMIGIVPHLTRHREERMAQQRAASTAATAATG